MSDSKFVCNAEPFWMVGRITKLTLHSHDRQEVLRLSIDVGHGQTATASLILCSRNVEQQRQGQLKLSELASALGITEVKDELALEGALINCGLIRINGAPGFGSELICVDFKCW